MLIRVSVMTACAAIALAAYIPIAQAADAQGRFEIWGPGDFSCQRFVQDVNTAKAGNDGDLKGMIGWADGYLTQYNRMALDVYDIGGGSNLSAVQTYLFNYCQQHPLDRFIAAVDALISALYPTHTKTSPH